MYIRVRLADRRMSCWSEIWETTRASLSIACCTISPPPHTHTQFTGGGGRRGREKEKQRENVSIHWSIPQMACLPCASAGWGQSQQSGTPAGLPCRTGTQVFGTSSTVFPGALVGEEPSVHPVTTWDASNTGNCWICCTIKPLTVAASCASLTIPATGNHYYSSLRLAIMSSVGFSKWLFFT